MKRLLPIMLVFALLLGLGAFASAEEPDWAAAFSSVLDIKQAEAEQMAEEYGFELYCGYYLYDIDKDGVPEMVVKMGTCEADYHGTLYRYVDGKAVPGEEFGLGHSSLYSDPGRNGMIVMWGHMGYAEADRCSLDGFSLTREVLYEDDLNERLQTDPDADYVYPGEVIEGSSYLDLYRLELRLPLYRYEEIQLCLEGRIPGAVACGDYPDGDPDFFDKIIHSNGEVIAVSADGFANSPGRVGFQELLRQNVAADWMDSDLTLLDAQLADLNGDGQPECVLELSKGDTSDRMCFYLSEQEGAVYAYLQNYAENIEVDAQGNLFRDSPYYQELSRLIFDKDEAFFLTLPLEYHKA